MAEKKYTQMQQVIDVLRDNGGYATLGNLYRLVDTTSWATLGIFPTVVSLICTAKAIQNIGSTQTALLGALEPVTAVILGVIILGETVSLRDIGGMTLIFLAVTLVVYRKK